MKTTLRSRKERAYSVLPVPLEDRLVYLLSSPHAIAWDPFANRLLYERTAWRYKVTAGTEDIADFGTLETTIAAAALPLTELAQGTTLATLEVESVVEPLLSAPFVWQRLVESIAVDPATGNLAVYSRRSDAPAILSLQIFTSIGSPLAAANLPQPDDAATQWVIPHSLVHADHVYGIERDATFWDEPGPPRGRVVKRSVGTPGSLVFSYVFAERYQWPHSLAVDRENGRLFVVSTVLFNPGTFDTYERTYLTELSLPTLAFVAQGEVSFGFDEVGPGLKPYRLGSWFPGSPNEGGNTLFDGYQGGSPRFISSGLDPETYTPATLEPDPRSTFRWAAEGQFGLPLGSLGMNLPTPIFRTPAGVVGQAFSELPELLEIS